MRAAIMQAATAANLTAYVPCFNGLDWWVHGLCAGLLSV